LLVFVSAAGEEYRPQCSHPQNQSLHFRDVIKKTSDLIQVSLAECSFCVNVPLCVFEALVCCYLASA